MFVQINDLKHTDNMDSSMLAAALQTMGHLEQARHHVHVAVL